MEKKRYRVVSYGFQNAELIGEFDDYDKAVETARYIFNTRHDSVSVIDLKEKEIIFSRDVDWV